MSTDQVSNPKEYIKYTRDSNWDKRPIRKGEIYGVILEKVIPKKRHDVFVFSYFNV